MEMRPLMRLWRRRLALALGLLDEMQRQAEADLRHPQNGREPADFELLQSSRG